MIDPAAIDRLDLTKAEVIDQLDASLREVINVRASGLAAECMIRLAPILTSNATAGQRLASTVADLQTLAVPFMAREDLMAFFSSNVLSLVQSQHFDAWEQIRTLLLSLPIIDRDEIKQGLITALRANSQSLGAGIVNTPQGPRPPTVGNWLRLYDQSVGKTPTPDRQEQFLANEPNVQALPADDQTRLRRLIHLYDRLKRSSLTPEGIEEDIVVEDEQGNLRLMSDGALVDMSASRPSPEAKPASAPVPAQPPPLPPVAPPQPRPILPAVPPPTLPPLPPTRPQPLTDSGRPAAPALGHPEDEAEIRAQQQKTTTAAGSDDADRIERILDQFITQNQLSFAEPLLEKRFRMVMKSFFKGIRSAADAVNLLARPAKIGGMAYDLDLARTLIEAATPISVSLREASPLPPQPKLEDAPAPPRPKIPPAPPTPSQPPLRPIPEALKPPPPPQYTPKPAPPIRRPDDRPAMSDIKVPSKLVGPVDELQAITLADFRRFGADTNQSMARVIEKIDLLGEESFAKRAEGIKAWRESPLYRLYLEMGAESMERGEPIGIVISRRATSNRAYLSEHEFNAIADLNQKLRF